MLQARERDKINVTGLVTAGINVIEFVRIKQLGCSEDLVEISVPGLVVVYNCVEIYKMCIPITLQTCL